MKTEKGIHELQMEDETTDFDPYPIYKREQIDQLLLQSHTDSSISREYFLDSKGELKVRKKRLPISNIFTNDISTSHLSVRDKEIITDLLELANDLIYHSKTLAKFSKSKKVLVNLYKIPQKTEVYLYKGYDRKNQKPILEKRIVEEELPVYVEREIKEDFFNLNPAIDYFLNEAVSIAHVSKGVDGNAARLSHHQSISEVASKFNYDRESGKIIPLEEEKSLDPGSSVDLGGMQDWATRQNKRTTPYGLG